MVFPQRSGCLRLQHSGASPHDRRQPGLTLPTSRFCRPACGNDSHFTSSAAGATFFQWIQPKGPNIPTSAKLLRLIKTREAVSHTNTRQLCPETSASHENTLLLPPAPSFAPRCSRCLLWSPSLHRELLKRRTLSVPWGRLAGSSASTRRRALCVFPASLRGLHELVRACW
jgi:hypothetical protein